jgi:hypothetical protein
MSPDHHELRFRPFAALTRRLVALGMSLSSVSAFSALSVPGCLDRVVTVPGHAGGSGGGGGSGVGTTGTGPTGAQPTALALMATELPANAMPCGYNVCTPPDDTLFIEIASLGNTCQAPLGPEMICGSTCNAPAPGSPNYWQLQIGLPAQDQAVGSYPLMDPAIYYETTYQALQPSSGSKGVGSGVPGFGKGTLQVVSIDKTQITVRLIGVSFNVPMDGEYVAKRCTPLP